MEIVLDLVIPVILVLMIQEILIMVVLVKLDSLILELLLVLHVTKNVEAVKILLVNVPFVLIKIETYLTIVNV